VHHPQITFTGLVDDTRPYFEAADLAINPMLSGSGTNLKQVEYLAMGLPTLATPVGMRGSAIAHKQQGFISTLEDFPAQLRWLVEHPEVAAQVRDKARLLATQRFDWSVIGAKMRQVYQYLEHQHLRSCLQNPDPPLDGSLVDLGVNKPTVSRGMAVPCPERNSGQIEAYDY
ncbi:MAG: glycosyltransferase, partial [Leptolyngbyaceae bacterium]|nr:glycosyltransferase [Leptolyngbyaceae bacterium]